MRHLSTETLARIADGPATEPERAHLDECPDCRAELDALREQLDAVAGLPPPPLPAGVRERIGDAVVARRAGVARPPSRPYGRWALQIAAALALFVGGTAVGARLDPGPSALAERERVVDEAPVEEPSTVASTASPDPTTAEASPEPALDELAGGPAEAEPSTRLARSPDGAEPAGRRAAERPGPDDPAATLREAEARYVEALARYVDERGGPVGGDPTNRLAALEGILYTTRAALDASPDDPVLEGFYQSALAQREAMLDEVTITTAQAVY